MKRSGDEGSVLLLTLTLLVVALVAVVAWQVYLGVQRQGVAYSTVSHWLDSNGSNDAMLSGTVSSGPTRPVCSADQSCASPVSNHVLYATDATGSRAATTQTDSDGHYTLSLQPGTYQLTLSPAVGIGSNTRTVTVHSGNNTYDFSIDTGIR